MNANTPDGPTTLHPFDIDHINGYAYRQRPSPRHVPLALPWTGELQATEVELAGSLRELTSSADAVVRGRVVAVVPGRVFGDPDHRPLHYATATLRVEELLAGSLPANHHPQLALEVPLFDGPASLAALPAWGEGILFLRNKGESARLAGLSQERQAGEAGFYRLVTFTSVVANDHGVALTAPDSEPLSELAGALFAEVVGTVRAAGR